MSRLAEPAEVLTLEGMAPELSTRYDDYVQLAHYTRMLQAAGVHPGDDALMGAIIGSDDLGAVDPSGHALVWLLLDEPLFKTFSRSKGQRKRSAIERYDHEHAFRLKVAQVARARTGGPRRPDASRCARLAAGMHVVPMGGRVSRSDSGEDAAALGVQDRSAGRAGVARAA